MLYSPFTIFTALCVFGLGAARAQTEVDLLTQSKHVNFSGSAVTFPITVTTSLPAQCGVGQMAYLSNATAGSNLYACTAANTWTLEAGGGGSGSSSITTLPDFGVTQSSATVLTIGGTCSVPQPCRARFGNTAYLVTQSATATISAGTGTAYIYLLPDGSLNVGSNLTISCSSCLAFSGVTAFPSNSIPLASWLASGGTWTSSSGSDVRAFQSSAVVVPQAGLTASAAPGETLLGIDTTLIGLKAPVPAHSAGACTLGSWSTDGTFFYFCTAANTWGRVALSSF